MFELQRIGIVHCDLAARNVLLDSSFQGKIGDLGSAMEGGTIEVDDKNRKEIEIPWRWVASEVAPLMKFNPASDAWAFGITLWEILTFGETPYTSSKKINIDNLACHHRLLSIKLLN